MPTLTHFYYKSNLKTDLHYNVWMKYMCTSATINDEVISFLAHNYTVSLSKPEDYKE